ncbi:MAG TPA: SGNH/GDSL hydrolase family protein [Herpetosiphonaceae bacterium]|nr:SGNH/GDSL hydrolase family protein [Herpetosiphonaceae bacterium]
MATPTIRRYVALGDSLSEGFSDWGRSERSIGFAYVLADLLREQIPDLEFTNLGESGARVADVLHQQVDRATELAPDLLTLVVGANDLLTTPDEQFQHDYDDLVGRLRSKTSGMIAIANIPDFAHLLPPQYGTYRAPLSNRTREFNHIIAATAATYGVLLVDLAASREVEDLRNLSGDGFHPNARGYRAMARIFAEALNDAGFELRLPVLDP